MTEPTLPPPARLPEIVDRVIATATAERVTLEAVIQSFGRASFTPILLLPAIAVATPLSGIPFFSSLMGLLIAIVSAQMLFRRRRLWLPDWLLRQDVNGAVLAKAFLRIRPVTVWLDRRTGARLRLLFRRPLIFVPQMLCLVSGLMMPLLEFIPFSSSVVGVGVSILALGLLMRDGVVILIGLLPYAVAIWLIVSFIAG